MAVKKSEMGPRMQEAEAMAFKGGDASKVDRMELAGNVEASATRFMASVAHCLFASQACFNLCRKVARGQLAEALAEQEEEMHSLLKRLLEESQGLASIATSIAWSVAKAGR